MKENILKIVIDPGFDFMKIIINGNFYKVPSTALTLTEEEIKRMYVLEKINENRILSRHQSGVIYVVGDEARLILQENADEKVNREYNNITSSTMEDMSRFKTEIFRAQLFGSLGYAFYNYCNDTQTPLESIIEKDIFVGLTLPHSYVDEGSEILQGILNGKHLYDVVIGKNEAKIEFEVKHGRTMAISQTIAALMSLSSDDEGNAIEKLVEKYEKYPAIVLDGGYFTLGIVDVRKGNIISNKSESNTEFAMLNINKELVKKIKEETTKTDIEDYNIEQRIETSPVIRWKAKDENGNEEIKEQDIRLWKESITKEKCDQLIKYLNEKFDDLTDHEQIAIAGGTGKAYAKYLEEYLREKRKHIQFTEIKAMFGGKELEPVYAIAIGMYKFITYRLNQLSE